jgi:hypothetical protein
MPVAMRAYEARHALGTAVLIAFFPSNQPEVKLEAVPARL